jgi:hypothetical protein
LEDQQFHPKETRKNASVNTPRKQVNTDEIEISPTKRPVKLRDKCRSKLGHSLFDEMYSFMRGLKSDGLS